MKSLGNTNVGITQVKLKKFLIIAGCILSINAVAANSSNNTTDKDSNWESKKNNWAGPYIGGYVGGAWGKSNFNTDAGTVTNTSYFSSTPNILSVNQNGSKPLEPNAFIGGVQVGNNWVLRNLIYGLALDFGSFHLHDSNNANGISYPTASPATYSLQTSMKTNWLFTARGRLGFIPRISWPLVYATGGLAVTKLQVVNNFSDNAASLGLGGASNSPTKIGWTVGAGLELPLTKNFTINSEYMYVNFGSVTATSSVYNSVGFYDGPAPVASRVSPFLTSSNLSANLFKVGLNYKI